VRILDPLQIKMVVMKTYCGCLSVKSGSQGILGFTLLIYVAMVILGAMKLAQPTKDWESTMGKIDESPRNCNETADYKDTWWCQMVQGIETVEFTSAIVSLVWCCVNLVITIIGIYGATSDKSCPLLPYIIFDFINWLMMAVWIGMIALVLLIYNPNKVDMTTSVAMTAAAILFLVLLLYFWLCVVSHYQSLREIESLAKDKVHIMQGDMYPYDSDMKGADDPHYDDIPTDRTALTPPPAYSSPDMTKDHMEDDIPEIEDIKMDDHIE